jgi:8-oxo-dGTP pyrophosphatase MutT (NUDIX family)
VTPSEAANHVRRMLAGHTPADASEEESLRRIVRLLDDHEDPWSRTLFLPGHLTASAVVVDASHERALLVFHGKLEMWLQPGGHFEPGERDPAVAAAREVLEETFLSTRWPGQALVLLDVDVHGIPAHKAEPGHEHFDLRLLLVAESDDARAGDGTRDVRWVGRTEAAGLDLDPGLQRALTKVWSR